MSGTEVDAEKMRRYLADLERENIELRERVNQIDRERAEYLQNVSHQLVAPLNAIKWHIENLTGGRIDVDRPLGRAV